MNKNNINQNTSEGGLNQEVKNGVRYIYMQRPKKTLTQRFFKFMISFMVLGIYTMVIDGIIDFIDPLYNDDTVSYEEYYEEEDNPYYSDTHVISEERQAQMDAKIKADELLYSEDEVVVEEEPEDYIQVNNSVGSGGNGLSVEAESVNNYDWVMRLDDDLINDIVMYSTNEETQDYIEDIRFEGNTLGAIVKDTFGDTYTFTEEGTSQPEYIYSMIGDVDDITIKLSFTLFLETGDFILTDVYASNIGEMSGVRLSPIEFSEMKLFI